LVSLAQAPIVEPHPNGQCNRSKEWAIVDSNHGPPPYQSGALTN
jgi:hypothetical protein